MSNNVSSAVSNSIKCFSGFKADLSVRWKSFQNCPEFRFATDFQSIAFSFSNYVRSLKWKKRPFCSVNGGMSSRRRRRIDRHLPFPASSFFYLLVCLVCLCLRECVCVCVCVFRFSSSCLASIDVSSERFAARGYKRTGRSPVTIRSVSHLGPLCFQTPRVLPVFRLPLRLLFCCCCWVFFSGADEGPGRSLSVEPLPKTSWP